MNSPDKLVAILEPNIDRKEEKPKAATFRQKVKWTTKREKVGVLLWATRRIFLKLISRDQTLLLKWRIG